jgi:integrase
MQITQRSVKNLKAPKEGNTIRYDDQIQGFGVRITARGIVAFILNYRIAGRERRYTIGRYPEWSADAARDEALELRAKIRKGADPLEERESSRTEPLMSDLANDYVERHALPHKRHGSVRNDRQMLERLILPRLGRLRVRAVGRRDIESLHASLKATPYHANRVLSLLSTMFSLAMEWKWRDDNPAKGLQRYQEDKRETWLSEVQLRRLEAALRAYRDQEAAHAIRLLIVTGARAGEVLQAEWAHFDLERGVWTKPSHHTKQKKIEHVPLNRAALSVLSDLADGRRGGFLFPGKQGVGPRVTLRRPWIQVLKAAGLTKEERFQGKRRILTRHRPTVRIHDLRHTFASHLVSRGESLHKVGKLLGHTSPQTTERYAHLDDAALRDTANNFGNVYRRLEAHPADAGTLRRH